MRRTLILILALVSVLVLGVELMEKAGGMRPVLSKAMEPAPAPPEKPRFPDRVGEKIVYDVTLSGVSLGSAVFNYQGKADLNGKSAKFCTFDTSLFHFRDKEKIYSDPETMFPLKVEREISSWPKYEKITEVYDQSKFTLHIVKTESGKDQVTDIKKDSAIHNAILLPYMVRQIPELAIGWNFQANLPTQSFKIELASIEDVKVAAGSFKAYHFKSTPERFEIWISDDERKIPLKIKGVSGPGYLLQMREYSPGAGS